MHFRIFKMIANSGFLTAVNCTKFVFSRGTAPGPAGGAYSAPQTSILAGSRGPTSKGGKEEGERGEGREGREKRQGRDEGEGRRGDAPICRSTFLNVPTPLASYVHSRYV